MISTVNINFWASIFTIAGAFFTIIGVISAIRIYFLWGKDYKSQQAHTYALSLLKKIKTLHLEIELLRKPKFHNLQTLVYDIENKYIPQIEVQILSKLVEIQVDLLIAETILIKHKDIQLLFNATVRKNIINKINTAVYMFYSQKNSLLSDIKMTELFGIIFPSEVKINDRKIKRSTLGTEVEIIDDDFNKVIENNFKPIYSALEDNLI